MRRIAAVLCLLALVSLFGCGAEVFDTGRDIDAITREEGSGTRGAFVDLFGLKLKGGDGTVKELITKEAGVENNTNTILTTVRSDEYAIGYVSMGSLDGSVKALAIDGVSATEENVKNGSYAVSRPFLIATRGEPEGLARDFIDFILSREGQEVAGRIYVPISEDAPPYAGTRPGGKLVVGGSSSVSPLMEKLIEAYEDANPNAQVQLQTTDSSMGMTKTAEGAYDIGMASRDLTDAERRALTDTVIALDGIALIVSPDNPAEGIASEGVRRIYSGEAATWREVWEYISQEVTR